MLYSTCYTRSEPAAPSSTQQQHPPTDIKTRTGQMTSQIENMKMPSEYDVLFAFFSGQQGQSKGCALEFIILALSIMDLILPALPFYIFPSLKF
jgi:hypothetical protein